MNRLKELIKEFLKLKEEQAEILKNYDALKLRNINIKIYNLRQKIKAEKRKQAEEKATADAFTISAKY